MGNIGTRALAAHQVAITLASATFMIPVGIGAAASVRVGRAVGRADPPGTRLAGLVAIGTGCAFMVLAALAFLLAPRAIAGIITSELGVIDAVVPLLFVAAVFQLSDGVQAVAAGALRGAGDTRFALIANLCGHYLIGLPIGTLLAFRLGLGASGLWWGLSAGLTAVAIALTLRFVRLSSRPIQRV
jgi:multidrug resistance protein, MATE family